MPKGRPENLKTLTPEQAREYGRKGGQNSAKAKAERKTIQTLLDDFLERDCKSIPKFEQLAQQLGIRKKTNIKTLFIAVSIANTMKNADLEQLKKLQELLGEIDESGEDMTGHQEVEDDPLTKALKEEAMKMEEAEESADQ